MPNVHYRFTITAPPARVFDALTDQNHVSKWWTPDCTLDSKVGGHAKFEFKSADGRLDGHSRMRIEKLVPAELVEWKCIEQDYQGVRDWVGTTIRFRLSGDGRGGTNLDFDHLDWKNTEGSYRRCTEGWNHVLQTSLKNYLEKGKGEPYLEQIAKESARAVNQ
jgi:uncharacterized protein YndB with AHSA1/START domain